MPAATKGADAGSLLQTYGLVSLQHMGRQRGLEIKGKSKSALVPLLVRSLFDPEAIKRSLRDLAPLERAVLERILLIGGEVVTGVLRESLQEEGLVEPAQDQSQFSYRQVQGAVTNKGSRKFEDIIGRLGVLGLVFSRRRGPWRESVEFRTPGSELFIPEPVRRHLPAVTLPAESAPPPPREIPGSPDDILRDVYILVSLARAEPFQLTARGPMTKRALIRLDSEVRRPEGAQQVKGEGDLGRLPLLRSLAEELELAEMGGGVLRPGPAVAPFFTRPRGWRLQQLFEAYRRTERWSELTRLSELSITPRTALNNPFVVAARQRVLAEIAELPAGTWIALDHLLARLHKRAYDFLLSRVSLYERYMYYPQFDARKAAYWDNPLGLRFTRPDESAADWELVEGGFIREMVIEPLYWLGVVDLGTAAREPRTDAAEPAPGWFRVTPVGAELLQGRTPSLVSATARVVIQPNFQILVFEPADEDVLLILDRLAQRLRAEQVTEYRLTRESIYTAQREGLEIGEIVATLERLSATPLPQNVRRTLEDWGAAHERIVIRRHVAALQSADEATLDRLANEPGLRGLLGPRLAPIVALLAPDGESAPSGRISSFAGALLAREARDGLPLPAISEGNDAGLFPAITIDREGVITFRDRVTSVYVLHAVRQLAEEESAGALRLAAPRLRQAAREIGRERDPAGVILDHLGRLNGSELPEEVVQMVRRWAQDWGRGALVETVLLQVERPEILAELLADGELKRLLQPVSGAPTLATVRREDGEQVRAALQERGMELQTRLL